jgi:hypothetical protein
MSMTYDRRRNVQFTDITEDEIRKFGQIVAMEDYIAGEIQNLLER